MMPVIPGSVAAAWGLVEPTLREAVARLDPITAQVARYHLGWTDPSGRPVSAGGKALRPALAMLSARAATPNVEHCVPAAAAVELVHAFSLLHDDIMDGDRTRRHRPAAWTVFGGSAAILGGDALLALAVELLAERGSALAARSLVIATRRLIAGQSLDLEFEQRADVTLEECRRMSAAKTGALIACACSIGAIAAEAPDPLICALAGFGAELGLAFQLADDLLGIWGDPEVTGKPVLADLRARKKTLPIVAALTSGTKAGDCLAGLLHRSEALTEEELYRAALLIDEAGGRSWAETEAERRLATAERRLAEAAMPDHVRAELTDIARFITSRDF